MAINRYSVAWLQMLASKGIIAPGMHACDFGPQGVHGNYDSTEQFYGTLGVTRYRSIDRSDPIATWKVDFNEPFSLPERFTLVTNFGTFEHVFNIAQAFKSMHDITEPGGIMLHIGAAFGYPDHGFWSLHPMVYLELAISNDYIVEDFRYVDRHNQRAKQAISGDVDFSDHPITVEQLRELSQYEIQRLIRHNFIKNYCTWGIEDLWDSCNVVLRKTNDSPFRWPNDSDWKPNRRRIT